MRGHMFKSHVTGPRGLDEQALSFENFATKINLAQFSLGIRLTLAKYQQIVDHRSAACTDTKAIFSGQ